MAIEEVVDAVEAIAEVGAVVSAWWVLCFGSCFSITSLAEQRGHCPISLASNSIEQRLQIKCINSPLMLLLDYAKRGGALFYVLR